MTTTYTYPANTTLRKIRQTFLPQRETSSEIRKFFPTSSIDTASLVWEQYDKYQGTMGVRGLNGPPTRLNPIGMSRFSMAPGYYGSYMGIDEIELTTSREIGTFATAINLDEPVTRRMLQLLNAEVVLREVLCWNFLINGTFTSTTATGQILDTQTYTQRTFAAATTWGTPATSTPLADMRAIKLLHRGFSVAFDGRATLYANQTTINNLLLNTNTADLGGKRRTGGATFNSIQEVNEVLRADNDLPMIVAYDEGYYDNTGTFQLYIPNNVAIVLGRRLDGAPLGEWLMTRNANAPGMAPGGYEKIVDNFERSVPREIEVHRGFNGGPVLYYPSGIVVMTV